MRERLWKKLVSLTLALALAIGMMPAIPGAVSVAHAATTITEVSVTDIAVPMVGDTPDYNASIPGGAAYYIGPDMSWTNMDVNGLLWVNNTSAQMNQEEPFAADGSYDVRMEIYAKDGAAFAAKENLNVTINGQAAHIISRTDNMIYIRYTFGAPKEKESINSVELTMKGHELKGLVRGLTFDSADPITVGSEYGTDKNYVVYLQTTTQHLTSESSVFYGWQQYYVGYYLEAKDGYAFHSLTPNQVTLNGQSAYSLTNQNDGRVLAIFALEKLGYIHEIELEVPLPAADKQITKPTVVSVDGDPSLNHLVSTEGSQWSASSFFIDGAEYDKVGSGNFQNGMAYKLELEACPADTNTYYLADDCKVTVKTSDGQILQRGQTWSQDGWHYKQTNYFNLNAPTAYDTLKNWDMEINGYNGGASLMNLSAKVTANGKTLMLPAGETFMLYEESFVEPEPPYLIKYDTQYILTMPLLTADMNWPGVDWVIDDINNVEITLHGQPLSVSDLMNMEGNWWVMYKLPILKQGTTCNGFVHDWAVATCTAPKTCKGCGAIEGSAKDHDWAVATCTAPKTCKVCGATEGTTKPHTEELIPGKAATLEAAGLTEGKKCSVCGTVTVTQETIAAIDTVKLSYTKKAYTGKTLTAPELTVTDTAGKTLVSGTDYTVTGLTGKKSVGRYKVTVTFKGSYAGSTDLYFNIVPKKTTSAKAALYGYDDVKFSWSKVTGASGYLVYYKKGSGSWSKAVATTGTSYKKANLSDGVKYTFKVVPYYKEKNGTTKYYDANQYKTAYTYTLKKVSGVKVAKSGTKVKVSWTNISGESGYQISKMTKKSATQKKPLTYKTTSGKYKKLSATKGKTYYYKVRAYKTVNGKNIYGPWSTVKAYKRK